MKHIIATVLVVLLVLPFGADASYKRYGSVDTSDLDRDKVEEISIPVLFGVAYEDVIPDFGASRDGGTRSHEGQDFMVPRGTPIVSPTEAVVLSTGEGDSAGLYVFTANPGGEVFRYMHLDDIANIERGDELDVGDFIGTVGDTGNAPYGAYHLHFEIRDDDNDALDPYPRLTDAFTLKEKVSFLRDIFRDIRDDDAYAEFLVTTFPQEFREALDKDYNLPSAIEDALEDEGFVSQQVALEEFEELLKTLPRILELELGEGDQGPAVALLQFYLIYATNGEARDRLAAAGPTGYYGGITAEAVREFQGDQLLAKTGVYDGRVREKMMKNDRIHVQLAQ